MNISARKLCMALAMTLSMTVPQGFAEEQSSASTTTTSTPVYRPPLRGAPATRVGGASRGVPDAELVLSVIAPESTGLTSRAQPTLYWYISKALSRPMEFTLNDEQSIKPLVDMTVPVAQPGIHALKLNYALKPEVEYQWTIAAVADPSQRASDTIASGTIRYVQLPATLATQIKSATPQQQPFLYAQEGFWYDAVTTLSEQIEAQPTNRSVQEQRAALLEQVGLKSAAEYDRGAKH